MAVVRVSTAIRGASRRSIRNRLWPVIMFDSEIEFTVEGVGFRLIPRKAVRAGEFLAGGGGGLGV